MADEEKKGSALNPALSALEPLVGEWRWEATVDGKPFGVGRTVYEWMEGGAFLREHSFAEQPEFPSVTTITGADDSSGVYCKLHFDSRAIARVYYMSLEEGVLKQWRSAPGFSQRFEGRFSSDGKTLEGYWEASEDGSSWKKDFDLRYSRLD